MNSDWLEWIRLNLKRGCDPLEIQKILLSNNFSNSDIEKAMGSAFSRGFGRPTNLTTASHGRQVNVDYAAISQPRLVFDPKVQRVPDNRLQLFRYDDFLSSQECDLLVQQINKQLRPSTITTGTDYAGFRTSTTCDLGHQSSALIERVDNKIAKTLGVRLSWSEVIQAQRYDAGQEFKAHTDYFTPDTPEFETYAKDAGQRTWTFMVYLNDDVEGGQTHFKEIEQTFSPKTGTAVIWNNLHADGTPNHFTMHHGMPVVSGHKIIITKWFRDKGKGQPLFPVRN